MLALILLCTVAGVLADDGLCDLVLVQPALIVQPRSVYISQFYESDTTILVGSYQTPVTVIGAPLTFVTQLTYTEFVSVSYRIDPGSGRTTSTVTETIFDLSPSSVTSPPERSIISSTQRASSQTVSVSTKVSDIGPEVTSAGSNLAK